MKLLRNEDLERVVPKQFAQWRLVPLGDVVQPRDEGGLTERLYSQVLGRVYENAASGEFVMLAIAYGDTQSDLLQLHRPETCYPAFGFELTSSRRTAVNFGPDVTVPTRSIVAKAPGRVENITYWTRLGEFLPASSSEQRLDKLRSSLAGYVPDGVLVRCSTLGDNSIRAFALNTQFLEELVLAVPAADRSALVGTKVSNEIRQLHLA